MFDTEFWVGVKSKLEIYSGAKIKANNDSKNLKTISLNERKKCKETGEKTFKDDCLGNIDQKLIGEVTTQAS